MFKSPYSNYFVFDHLSDLLKNGALQSKARNDPASRSPYSGCSQKYRRRKLDIPDHISGLTGQILFHKVDDIRVSSAAKRQLIPHLRQPITGCRLFNIPFCAFSPLKWPISRGHTYINPHADKYIQTPLDFPLHKAPDFRAGGKRILLGQPREI